MNGKTIAKVVRAKCVQHTRRFRFRVESDRGTAISIVSDLSEPQWAFLSPHTTKMTMQMFCVEDERFHGAGSCHGGGARAKSRR